MSDALPLAALNGADAFGLAISFVVCVYLVYALICGEKL